jgi:hypothetical protein
MSIAHTKVNDVFLTINFQHVQPVYTTGSANVVLSKAYNATSSTVHVHTLAMLAMA